MILFGLVCAGSNVSSSGLTLWQPQLIKSSGLTTTQTGGLNSVSFIVAAFLMVWWSLRADKAGELAAPVPQQFSRGCSIVVDMCGWCE